MTCRECGSIMIKTPTGGGACSNCGHVTDEPYEPIQAWQLGVGGALILDEALRQANERIAILEAQVNMNALTQQGYTMLNRMTDQLQRTPTLEHIKESHEAEDGTRIEITIDRPRLPAPPLEEETP